MKKTSKKTRLRQGITKELSEAPARTLYYVVAGLAIVIPALLASVRGSREGTFVLSFLLPVGLYIATLSYLIGSYLRSEDPVIEYIDTVLIILVLVMNILIAALGVMFRALRDELVTLIPDSPAKTEYVLNHQGGMVEAWISLLICLAGSLVFLVVFFMRDRQTTQVQSKSSKSSCLASSRARG